MLVETHLIWEIDNIKGTELFSRQIRHPFLLGNSSMFRENLFLLVRRYNQLTPPNQYKDQMGHNNQSRHQCVLMLYPKIKQSRVVSEFY